MVTLHPETWADFNKRIKSEIPAWKFKVVGLTEKEIADWESKSPGISKDCIANSKGPNNTPPSMRKAYFNVEGVTMNLEEACKHFCVSRTTLYTRMGKGLIDCKRIADNPKRKYFTPEDKRAAGRRNQQRYRASMKVA